MQTTSRTLKPRPARREGERPRGITLTGEVVWARARLWHRSTVHLIVFTASWDWRLVCTGQTVDNDFDIRPDSPENCAACDRAINWSGAVRRSSYDGAFWAY